MNFDCHCLLEQNGQILRRGRRRRRSRGAWKASLTSAAFVRLNYKLIAFYAYKFAASHRATTAKIKLAKCIYLVNWQTRLQLATCNLELATATATATVTVTVPATQIVNANHWESQQQFIRQPQLQLQLQLKLKLMLKLKSC